MPSLGNASVLWKIASGSSTTYPTTQTGCDASYANWSLINTGLSAFLEVIPENSVSSPIDCYIQWIPSQGGSIYATTNLYITSGACPDDWEDNGSGTCVPYEPPTCEANNVNKYIFGTTSIYTTPASVSENGCGYSRIWEDGVSGCFIVADGSTSCTSAYYPTGLESSVDDTVMSESPPVSTGNESVQYPESSDLVVSAPSTITDPDGTVTTTEDVINTRTNGEGTEIWETDDFIFIKDSSGITTVTQKNTVTISNPDGSSTVTEQKNRATTPPNIEETSMPKSGSGSPTVTASSGDTIVNNSVTNTYHYDASGNLTGSESSSDTGDTEETDEDGETVYATDLTQGDFDAANGKISTDIQTAKADLLALFNDIKVEAGTIISFSHSGTGALPCPPPVSLGTLGEFDLCLTNREADLSFIANVILLTGAVLALLIILR